MQINATIRSYNKSAKKYEAFNLEHREGWKNELKYFFKLLKKGRVLDIGSGAGFDSLVFTKRGYDYLGIDASKEMIKLAKKRNKHASFILMDMNRLIFPKQTFDGFWASASLLHVKRSNITKVLKSINRILKPGGIGFIALRKIKDKKEAVITDKKHGYAKRYFAFYSLYDFNRIFKNSGFKVLKSYNWGLYQGKEILCFYVTKI